MAAERMFASLFAGAPAAYLALWLLLFPFQGAEPTTVMLYWRLPPIFVFIEIAAFVWPMWSFHRLMAHQKRVLVAQTDELARRISSVRGELCSPTNPVQVKELHTRITLDISLYEELEGLPTWPVSKQIRRRFALQSLLVVAFPAL